MVAGDDLKRCPLCSGGSDPAGINGKVRLVKCRNCGFVYAGASDAEIAAANRCGEEEKDIYRRIQSAFDRAWFDWLVSRFPGKTVLDIGCGNGLLLSRYQAAGWSVAGVDPAPWARTSDYPLFDDVAKAQQNFYDVVMCTSVLEHIPNPAEMVLAALAAARPGGVVYLSVPNFDSWAARRRPERMRAQDLPYHCNFFTPKDLRHICSLVGVRSFRVRSYGLPLAWDLWRKHRLKIKPTPKANAVPVPVERKEPVPTWKHRLVVKAYYWAGLWRGDKLELCIRKPA
jgi:SAM-dependent methyltransferase